MIIECNARLSNKHGWSSPDQKPNYETHYGQLGTLIMGRMLDNIESW